MKKESAHRILSLAVLFGIAMPTIALLYSLQDPAITGKVSAGVASFCFMGQSISISSFSPAGVNILNGTVTLRATMSNISGLSALNITFTYLNDSVTQTIGTDMLDGDAAFAKSWDTTTIADGKYN